MIGEILGYVGTILVLISFIPKDIKMIRVINIFGCIVWIISAIFSKSYSVMTLNSILMIVHLIHIIQLYRDGRIKHKHLHIKPTEQRNFYNALCEDLGLEVDYTNHEDPTEEEFDKLRYGISNHFRVPYYYLYPNKENFVNEDKCYFIADKNGKHCDKFACLNYGNSCRFCNEGDMYKTIKGE